MVMVYTMAPKNGHWVVVRRGDSQGHQFGGEPTPAEQNLPPGHPPVDGAAQGSAGSDTLPPGHPPLAQPQGQAK
jgi:hypothetical protein